VEGSEAGKKQEKGASRDGALAWKGSVLPRTARVERCGPEIIKCGEKLPTLGKLGTPKAS